MENKKAIAIIKDELKHCQIHLRDKNKAPEYYQEMNELCEAYEMAIKALEKNNEMLEYLKMSLSQSDELKEKHRNVDDDGLKENHKRMAIIFEGMGEAYDDLLNRFFKEDSDHEKYNQ